MLYYFTLLERLALHRFCSRPFIAVLLVCHKLALLAVFLRSSIALFLRFSLEFLGLPFFFLLKLLNVEAFLCFIFRLA